MARASRLKRRANTVAPEDEIFPATQRVSSTHHTQRGGEPPHKRFKALFDETTEESNDNSAGQGSSVSTGATGPGTRAASVLSTTSMASVEGALTRKDGGVEEMEMDDGASTGKARSTSARPRVDKEASHERFKALFDGIKESGTETGNSGDGRDSGATGSTEERRPSASKAGPTRSSTVPTESGAPSSSTQSHKSKNRGALPNQPDKDPKFLEVLASTSKKSRGKKVDDTFDREFNQLRISALEQRREEEAAVWEKFEKDMDIRGNFMVIEVVDLFRKDGGRRTRAPPAENEAGVPNFKKFKKVRCVGTWDDSDRFNILFFLSRKSLSRGRLK